jgi:hypothetical protein
MVPEIKNYVPGASTTYSLKVTNKVGTATTTFRIDRFERLDKSI